MVIGFIGIGIFTFLLIYIFGICTEDRETDVCHKCSQRVPVDQLTLVQCGLASGRFCHSCVRELDASRRVPVLLAVLALLMFGSTARAQCDIDLGRSGSTMPLVLHLQAGVAQSVVWDFTGCTFGIQNFTVYATQPRPCPSCLQKALPKNAPLTLTANGQNCVGFVCYLGKVSGTVVEVVLLSSRKLDVELTYTAAFGGAP